MYKRQAYADHYRSWVEEISKKNVPGAKLESERLEGMAIIRKSAAMAKGEDRARIESIIAVSYAHLDVYQRQGQWRWRQ